MKNKIPLILVFWSVLITFGFAQQTAVSFLVQEPTAKANGLGGSFTAIANDGSAMYYNPAGLVRISYGSFDYGYYNYYPRSDYLNDYWLRYYAATANVPTIGRFGINLTYLHLPENIITDENGNIIGTTHANEWALSLGYAGYFKANLALGAALKLIRSNLEPGLKIGSENYSDGMAAALDLGLLYENFLPELVLTRRFLNSNLTKWSLHRLPPGPSLGLVVRNIGPAMAYAGQSTPLPQQLRLGLAWNLIDTDIFGLLLASDLRKMLVHESDGFIKSMLTSWEGFSFNHLTVSYGAELSLFTVLTFRYGIFVEDKHSGLYNFSTYGISFGPETFRLNWYKKKYDHKLIYNTDDNYWRIGFSAAY